MRGCDFLGQVSYLRVHVHLRVQTSNLNLSSTLNIEVTHIISFYQFRRDTELSMILMITQSGLIDGFVIGAYEFFHVGAYSASHLEKRFLNSSSLSDL